MDLSINSSIFSKNLKFWGFHTLINAIPSVIIAYMHGWDTLECCMAMGFGIIIFATMLTLFMSMKSIHKICNTGFMARAIKAGIYFRIILFVTAISATISFIIFCFGGDDSLQPFATYFGLIWASDFITGIISHAFYQSLKKIIPIRGIHHFFPTIFMTILQGTLIMFLLITSGIILAVIVSCYKAYASSSTIK